MDYYQILGITRSASDKDVKAAFRKIALKYHPDKHTEASPQTKAETSQRFKAATEAYETLVDAKKRSKYNLRGHTGQPKQQYDYGAYQYQGYTTSARPRGSLFNFFSAVARGTTRVDAFFHAGLASILVVGFIASGYLGDYIWTKWNKGRLFQDLDREGRHRSIAKARVGTKTAEHFSEQVTSIPATNIDCQGQEGDKSDRDEPSEVTAAENQTGSIVEKSSQRVKGRIEPELGRSRGEQFDLDPTGSQAHPHLPCNPQKPVELEALARTYATQIDQQPDEAQIASEDAREQRCRNSAEHHGQQ